MFQNLTKFSKVQVEKDWFFQEIFYLHPDVKGQFIHYDIAELFVLCFKFIERVFSFFHESGKFLVVEFIDCDGEMEVIIGDCD